MGKWITRILTVVLLGVFLYSGWKLLSIHNMYASSEKVYSGIAEELTAQQEHSSDGESPDRGQHRGRGGGIHRRRLCGE